MERKTSPIRRIEKKIIVPPKWPNRLVIVRHGESELNLAHDRDIAEAETRKLLDKMRETADHEINLTEKGVSQAQQTGKYLATYPKFDICFASPYQRTKDTAHNIVSQFNYEVPTWEDDRLVEKSFGILHGLTKKEVEQTLEHEFLRRKRDGKYFYAPAGGESMADVGQRVHLFLDGLSRGWGGKNVLVVTHQVTAQMFRRWLEHYGFKEMEDMGDMHNCGIIEYQLDKSKHADGRLKLVKYDYAAHDLTKKK